MKQSPWHINLMEIEAAILSLQEVMKQGDVVHLYQDSMVAVAFVNRQGGTIADHMRGGPRLLEGRPGQAGMNQASWLPREKNEQEDFLSKYQLEMWDFSLRPEVAEELWQHLYRPDKHLFASSQFHCAKDNMSCSPDSKSSRVDAFAATSWPDYSYAFPPVPLISKCLAKIRQFNISVIMEIPMWRTAGWWDQLQELAQKSITLGKAK